MNITFISFIDYKKINYNVLFFFNQKKKNSNYLKTNANEIALLTTNINNML